MTNELQDVRPAMLAAVPTPFGSDGEVNLEALGAHLQWLYDEGVHGVFLAGSTGEGVLLEDDEVVALVEHAAAGSMRVIAQVGRPSTRATVALAHRVVAAGAPAVSAYVPWFYHVEPAGIREHYLALLEAAGDVPALMYSVPELTGNELTPELAGELARAGLAGMKDSTDSEALHDEYREAVQDVPGFELYIGSERLIPRSVRAGTAGSISGICSCWPEALAAVYDALADGDDARATRLHERLMARWWHSVRDTESPLATIKLEIRAQLDERGIDYPYALRPPLG